MPCDEIELQAYFDQELGGEETVRVERHLRECPQCQRLYSDLRWLHASLRPLPLPTGSATRVSPPKAWKSWRLALAAGLTALVGGSLWLVKPGPLASPSAAPGRYSLQLPQAVYEVSVQDCQLLEVEIRDDQQVVRLDTKTTKSL